MAVDANDRRYARVEGLQAIEGQVFRDNTTMLAMCKDRVSTSCPIRRMSLFHREAFDRPLDGVRRLSREPPKLYAYFSSPIVLCV